ncbi:MAG: hypothetical protein JXN65_00235 [Clostridia bacterium]|nr:hypothetical protein [Clostridia bacterium]
MKFGKKELIIVVALIFVVSALAYYGYYLTPALADIDGLNSSIEQKKLKILSMQTAIDEIDNIKNEITTLEAELALQSEDIPRGISLPLQLVDITNVLNDRCRSQLIIFDESNLEFESYQKNEVNLSFVTSYENLRLILNEFQNMPIKNQVVTMSVTLSLDDTVFYSGILNGDYLLVGLNVEFYAFYPDPEAEPLEKQPFEDGPIEGKNPFRATKN